MIEDLYSWTPETLRRALLDYILSLELETRRRLIKQWRYSIDDRRGQVLSLLAANTFRPSMQGEELSGDDPDKIDLLGSTMMERNQESPHTFSLYKGVLWFVNLWIGFYLPQILARNRQDDIASKDPQKGRVRGLGWDLHSGPTHSIREALSNGEVASTGMMLVEPHDFSQQIQPELRGASAGEMDSVSLLLHIWCFYGQERRPWAAVSFWKGLALLGQLLVLRERELFQKSLAKGQQPQEREGEEPSGRSGEPETAPIRAIASLIYSQCELVRVPGALGEEHVEYQPFRPENTKQDCVERLAKEVDYWLYRFDNVRITPFQAAGKNTNMSRRDREKLWRDCFIRRMHGDHILGDFWRMLEGTYLEQPDSGGGKSASSSWTAWTALNKWAETLLAYTEKGRRREHLNANPFSDPSWVTLFFADCPFIRPFLASPRQKEHRVGMSRIFNHQEGPYKERIALLKKEVDKERAQLEEDKKKARLARNEEKLKEIEKALEEIGKPLAKEKERYELIWPSGLRTSGDDDDSRSADNDDGSVFDRDKVKQVFNFLSRSEGFEGGADGNGR